MTRPFPALLLLAAAVLALPAVFFGTPHFGAIGLVMATALLQLALGAVALLLVTSIAGRGWGDLIAPVLRRLVALLPLAILLLVPLYLVAGTLLPWVTHDPASLPEPVQAKLAWLNLPFLALRTVICAALWLLLAWAATLRPAGTATAVLGLTGLALTASVYDIDWIMGLEPEFVSTIHPLVFVSTMLLSAMAAAMLWYARTRGETEEAIRRGEDIANVTFGFLLLRAYLGYMQWVIIWAGDRPHEIAWFLTRTRDGWLAVLLAIIALAVIAAVGMSLRRMKRHRGRASLLAATLLALEGLDAAWRAAPPLTGPSLAIAAVLALAAALLAVALGLAPRKEASHA